LADPRGTPVAVHALPSGNFKVTVQNLTPRGHPPGPPLGPSDFISFTGQDGDPGPNQNNSFTQDAAGDVFIAGKVTRSDGSGITDAAVTQISPDGTTCRAIIAFLTDHSSGQCVSMRLQDLCLILAGTDGPNAFAVKLSILNCLSPIGDPVIFSDTHGGTVTVNDDIVDPNGHVLLTGADTNPSGETDVFGAALNADLTQTFFAGPLPHVGAPAEGNVGNSVAEDDRGNVFVTGAVGVSGNTDPFVLKVDPSRQFSDIRLTAHLPGPTGAGQGIDFVNGSLYVTGTLPNNNPGDRTDLLWAKLDTNLNLTGGLTLPISGGNTSGSMIALDDQGNAYVAGAFNFPGQPTHAVVVKFDPNGNFQGGYAFRGSNTDRAIAVNLQDTADGPKVLVGGLTQSPDFPLLNPFQANFNGSQDGFVARLPRP
jgi:hypothetical protein